jgi:hypothetical protein
VITDFRDTHTGAEVASQVPGKRGGRSFRGG